MKVLLDTHLLLWAAAEPDRLPSVARELLERSDVEPVFSSVSLWEVSIKRALDRPDFQVDPRLLRRGLIDNGYVELAMTGEHAVAVFELPSIHKDPFDRMLIAQAIVSGIELLTADSAVAQYAGPIRQV